MKYRTVVAFVCTALFLVGLVELTRLQPTYETGVLPTNPPTPYIHYLSRAEPHRRALVVHGLDSNKEFMQLFSSALADAGVEAYVIDLPGHGDSIAGFDGVRATSVLQQIAAMLKPDIAVGHSLGAGLLIDLAHDVKFHDLVLISPAPTEINAPQFERTLVVTEGFDLPFVNIFAPELEGVDVMNFRWGMHSTALVNPLQIREIVSWLGVDPGPLHTIARQCWLALMFAAAIALAFLLFPAKKGTPAGYPVRSWTEIIVSFVIAGSVALVVERFVNVFHWIRLYATDYLVSFVFVTGLVLLIGLKSVSIQSTAVVKAIGAAAYVILVLGVLTGSNLIHMSLSDGRWWRFIAIAAASFPLFLFDEAVICIDGRFWRSAAIGIATRALLVALMATGVLLLNRESAFLVLLLGMILLFWIGLWLFTALIRRNTHNPIATALFAALVQGYMFAAWFVTV